VPDDVQVDPAVVLLLVGGQQLGGQPPDVVEARGPSPVRGSQATGEYRARSIGPSTTSPVSTSITRSTLSSEPPSLTW
jgi:hypothetical protein